MDKAKEFLDYVKESKSKNTHSLYKMGLGKFIQWYGKTANQILEERKQDMLSEDRKQRERFQREIEKFFKSLTEQKFTKNSARSNCLGIVQFFRYYGFPITFESGTDVTKVVMTAKDFIPTIQQYRDMFNIADLRARVILSMGLDLGWRIGDFITITKAMIPDLHQEVPIPFDLITQKETILAKSFLSAETVELLKAYLPTLKEDNPYLFQSNGHNHLDPETVGDVLKGLAEKCKIKILQGKRLRFHAFRKRFLSTCADLHVDVNLAKILVGKSVEASMLAYLSEADLRKAFLEVKQLLNLSNGKIKQTIEAKDMEIQRLQKEVEELKAALRGFSEIFSKEITDKTLEKLREKGIMTISEGKQDPYDMLVSLGKAKEEERRKEYQKLIESNNDNGNNNH